MCNRLHATNVRLVALDECAISCTPQAQGAEVVQVTRRKNMPQKTYVRDGSNRIIVTTQQVGDNVIARDEHGEILGRSSERFHTTRARDGRLVSINTADPGLLFSNRRQR